MVEIKINGKDYKIEYSFAAAENNQLLENMFKVASQSYIMNELSKAKTEEDANMAIFNGSAKMIADVPKIAQIAFISGFDEYHNDLSIEDRKELLKAYIKAEKLSLRGLFDRVKEWMETDGFFDLTGLNETVQEMTENIEKAVAEVTEEMETLPVVPQDHKKKSSAK